MLNRVAEGVLVHQSELLKNNAVVVQGPGGALLVDPGLTTVEMICLADDLRDWDGPRVRVIEHPAHSPGHAALLVEDCRVLVAGDMLSDLFVPMLDDVDNADDPVGNYLRGLQRLEDVAEEVDVVVPGHGSVGGAGQASARIDQDRAYLHALRDGRAPDDPRVTSPEPGWEWVSDIHAGQAASLSRTRSHGGGFPH